MPEQVVIEFISNTEGLQKSVDGINAVTGADKALETQFKKGSDAMNAQLVGATDKSKIAKVSLDQMSQSVRDLNKETLGIGAGSQQLKKFADEVTKAATTGKTLVTQLRAMKQELALMEQAGNSGTKAFDKLAIQAAKLEDQIGDTARRIRVMASDTFALDAGISIVQGLAGAFAAAQGAVGLLAGENEDLQKALLKVQSAMAVLAGIQQVVNTLQKQSPAIIGVQTAAQAAYTFVVGTSTGALKLFRIALAATGIGLIVLAVAALVSNFQKLKDKVLDLFPALNGMGDLWDTIKAKVFGFLDATLVAVGKVATILFDLVTGQFGKVIDEIKTFGADVAEAYNQGVQEEMAAQAKEATEKMLAETIKTFQRQAALLDAQGKDSFNKKKEQLNAELALLKSQTGSETDEYKDKYNEILVLNAGHNKDLLDQQRDSIEKQKTAEKKKWDDFEIIIDKGIAKNEQLGKATAGEAKRLADELENLVNEYVKLNDAADNYALSAKDQLEELVNKTSEANEKQTQTDKDYTDAKIQNQIQAAEMSASLANNLFNFGAALRNAEIAEIEEKLDKGIITEKQAAKEIADIKRKQAVADKAQGAFNVIISTALAIAKATSQTGILAPFVIPLMVAIGAAQLATVLAQPIPKFAKGTKAAPPGFKLVGEQGPELIHDKGGYPIIPNKDTQMILANWNVPSMNNIPDLPYISDATMAAMENFRMNGNGRMEIDYDKLADKMAERLGEEIAKHPKSINHWDKRGFTTSLIQAGNERKSLDDYHSWNG